MKGLKVDKNIIILLILIVSIYMILFVLLGLKTLITSKALKAFVLSVESFMNRKRFWIPNHLLTFEASKALFLFLTIRILKG